METVHDKFNALDADLTVKSSDHILFKLHKRNLAVTSGVFPGPEVDSTGQIIDLAEPSAVLEAVFEFLYPERHPRLADKIDFLLLAQIAETAQKYEVYAATDACENKFYEVLPAHGVEIMAYALGHNNHKLADACALRLCRYPISDVIQGIPLRYALHWVRYHEKCSKLLFDEAEYISLYPIYGVEYNDPEYNEPKQDDVRCSLDVLNWIGMLKKKRDIDTINNAIVQFPRAHMDEMPHHIDYEHVFHTDEICDFANNAVNAVRKGVQDVEKKLFSSYYLANNA